MSAPTFSLEDLAAEAERELAARIPFYPRQVEAGKMTPELAERQISLMTEIARDLRAKAIGDRFRRTYSDRVLLECAERELRYRRRVYDRAVGNRTMSRKKADRLEDLMRAIADHYRAGLAPEPKQESLL